MGFEEAFNEALSRDPDFVLMGEMLDEEVARAAMNAAATGHAISVSIR